ncbi:response regulator [Nannocystaceae bacterium ST9]
MIGLQEILAAKILIVDDQPINVMLIERMLRNAGYLSISSTLDPREVCELHRINHFDLILLDLRMPGFDGFRVMEDLKEVETSYLPIIVVTVQPDHLVRALRAGAKDFVSKPFDFAEVLVRIHNMLEVRLLHSESTRLYAQVVAAQQEQAHLFGLAQQAIRARDDVLGIVAHDLRSPLNTIVLQLELLRRMSKANEAMGAPVERLDLAARQMERLIRDLLDVALLDAGRGLAMVPTRVDPRTTIDAAVDAKRGAARAAKVALEVVGDQPIADVWADGVRLLQVLDNLLGNAIKFTPPGGRVRIEIATRIHEVVFSIIDTGAGISAEQLPHLFDRFWQANPDDRRGAGLGLAIVQGIVKALGGRVWVESTLGAGTTFRFSMPLASLEPRAVSKKLEVARDRFTILLVEDEASARLALNEILLQEGYRVLMAEDAANALEQFAKAESVDLLLTDVRLGATDGLELAEQILARRKLPVVYMTGMLGPTDAANGAFIRKPIDLVELLPLLEHELATHHARAN